MRVLLDATSNQYQRPTVINNEGGSELSAPAPLPCCRLGQWAAWKASTTVLEIRPRSETWWPFCRAHARIAAVCSRTRGCGGADLAVIFDAAFWARLLMAALSSERSIS